MYSNVYHQMQGMLGIDIHVWELLVSRFPWSPHISFAKLQNGWGKDATALSAENIVVDGNWCVMQRGTDIGPLIMHYPLVPAVPHLLLPGYIAFSGSKSEYGANKVRVNGAAIAVAQYGNEGANLNCSGYLFPPIASGTVNAWTTVQAWMSERDEIAGDAASVKDSVIQWGLNMVFGTLGSKIGGPIDGMVARALGPYLPSFVKGMAGSPGANALNKLFSSVISGSNFVALLIGSPLGVSGSNIGLSAPEVVGKALAAATHLPIDFLMKLKMGKYYSWTPVGNGVGDMLTCSHDAIAGYYNDSCVEEFDVDESLMVPEPQPVTPMTTPTNTPTSTPTGTPNLPTSPSESTPMPGPLPEPPPSQR